MLMTPWHLVLTTIILVLHATCAKKKKSALCVLYTTLYAIYYIVQKVPFGMWETQDKSRGRCKETCPPPRYARHRSMVPESNRQSIANAEI